MLNVDWQVLAKVPLAHAGVRQSGELVEDWLVVVFMHVYWMRRVDDHWDSCAFDDPEAEARPSEDVMSLTLRGDQAAPFEIGKTYRTVFE